MARLSLSSRLVRRILRTSRNYRGLEKHQRFWQIPHFATTVKMSSIGGATIGAGLYAAVSNPAQLAAKPEEADEKRHHLKNGKGFTNPWDSYVESSPWELLIKGMLW
jgi:hypothetical protein